MDHLMFPRPTYSIINLENLKFNFRSVKNFVGGEPRFMAVVKADAYGHGAVECARTLEAAGSDWFGVATLEEALELRSAGIHQPILCFGGSWPGQETAMLANAVTPVIFDLDTAKRISHAAGTASAKVHVKIDTGMLRIGVPVEDAHTFASELSKIRNLEVEGIMSHFAAADDLEQTEFTEQQTARFHGTVEQFRDCGIHPSVIDIANSPGAVAFSGSAENLIRIGGLLYGLGGDVLPPGIAKPELKPVMSLVTKLAQVKNVSPGATVGYGRTFSVERESILGTVAVGYHDGYRRGLSNTGRVLVNGQFAPVVGRVSMDWTIVDLTDVPKAKVGDEVVMIGRQGERWISAEDLARDVGTISYEITCGISKRVPRVHQKH